jgi:hypothetical protein
MYYFFQVLFKVFFLIYYLAGVISLFDCVTEDCLQIKNLIKYIDLLKDLI